VKEGSFCDEGLETKLKGLKVLRAQMLIMWLNECFKYGGC